jgi:hypothetical protein
MIIHQTKNKNYLIFAVGSLTVKHMDVAIAIKNLPITATRLLPAPVVFLRRDTVTLPAPPKLLGVAWHACAAGMIKG